MPTDEEKQAMIEEAEARAKVQDDVVETKTEAIKEFRTQAESDLSGGAAVQPGAVTEGFGEAVDEYGPYDEPRVIPTPYGENQVAYGKVLFFKDVEVFDKQAARMVTSSQPFYRNATTEEMAPIRARRAKKKELNRLAQVGG